MDGWVTLGARLDTKELEKGIKQAQNDLKTLEKEESSLKEEKTRLEVTLEGYDETIAKYENLKDELEDYMLIQKDLQDKLELWRTDQIQLSPQEYEELTTTLVEADKKVEDLSISTALMKKEVDEVDKSYADISFQLDDINAKLENNLQVQGVVAQRIQDTSQQLINAKGMESLNAKVKNVGKSITGIIKKVGKWGLALLGVRTVLSILSQSFSTLSQYNEGLANKLQGIKLLLAVALEPVINWLINALQRVMQLIGAIYKALTGIDIYARANELMAQKTAKSYGGMAKSAKEIRKQLAGFDEMNVLADNVASAGGGGGASTGLPEIGNLEATEDQLESIRKKWKIIKDTALGGIWDITRELGPKGLLSTLGGIPTSVALNWDTIKQIQQNSLSWVTEHLLSWWTQTQLWVYGKLSEIGNWVMEKFNALKDFFSGFWEGIKLGLSNTWTSIKNTFSTIWTSITNTISAIGSSFSNLWENIKLGFSNAWTGIKNFFSNIPTFFSNIINNIITFFKTLGSKVGEAISNAFKTAINGVLSGAETLLNKPIKTINSFLDVINPYLPKKIGKLKTFSLPRLAKGGIVNMPSKGVPIGGAIAGESGAEGVIPLTDSQQMALLGQAIGKYITVDIVNPIYMNGRQIAKEINKVNNESNFAFNR